MTSAKIDQINKAQSDAVTETGHTAEQIATVAGDELVKNSRAIEQTAKENADALTRSSSAALGGLEQLAKAYQSMAIKNAERLTASFQAIAAVKSPTEFIELQRKLVAEGVADAANDYRSISKLTEALFTATFAPIEKQAETLQHAAER